MKLCFPRTETQESNLPGFSGSFLCWELTLTCRSSLSTIRTISYQCCYNFHHSSSSLSVCRHYLSILTTDLLSYHDAAVLKWVYSLLLDFFRAFNSPFLHLIKEIVINIIGVGPYSTIFCLIFRSLIKQSDYLFPIWGQNQPACSSVRIQSHIHWREKEKGTMNEVIQGNTVIFTLN